MSTSTTACCPIRRFVGRLRTKCTSAPVAPCPRTSSQVRPRPVGSAVKRTDRPGARAAHRPTPPHDRQFRTALPRARLLAVGRDRRRWGACAVRSVNRTRQRSRRGQSASAHCPVVR
jgi:hypothetical protein